MPTRICRMLVRGMTREEPSGAKNRCTSLPCRPKVACTCTEARGGGEEKRVHNRWTHGDEEEGGQEGKGTQDTNKHTRHTNAPPPSPPSTLA